MTNCHVKTPHLMYQYNLGYKQSKLQVVPHTMKISICPYTRAYDILGLIRPLIVDNASQLLGVDNVFSGNNGGATKYSSAVGHVNHV